MNEQDLIARYFAPLAGPEGLGLKDDAALLTPPAGCDLVFTADALVAGKHFFAEDPPDAIAAKALAVNLSDLAAKGAIPLGFLLSLALPPDCGGEAFLAPFAQGLGEAARAADLSLYGGDTVATSGPLTLSITAIGAVPSGRMVRRAGARRGDLIFVSGAIGDAALGLALRRAECAGAKPPAWAQHIDRAPLLSRYLRPLPRLALAKALRSCASAAMDVSDGLIGDLRALMRASDLAAQVELARIPLSPPARAALAVAPELFETLLTGGDDYEILCAVPLDNAARFQALAEEAGVPVTRIGQTGEGEALLMADGALPGFATDRFSHF